MIRAAAILSLSSFACLAAAERQDLLRFTNGDQLHGRFLGIKPGLQAAWQREDLAAPVDFKTGSVRHIVLRGGRPARALESLSHAGLVNGDRIPGMVTGMDDEQVTLTSACAGVLRIPRGQVSMVAPNPLGGRVHYHGPFSEEDWKMTTSAFPDGLPAAADGAADEKAPGRWTFAGAAWYWQEKTSGTALIRENGMPDRTVFSFDLAWKNRLSLAVAFHADFARVRPLNNGEGKDGKIQAMVPGDPSHLPSLFGNSYVLQFNSNYLMLFRTSVDADGNTSLERVQTNNNNLRLGEIGNAKIEIRSNRRSGGISLFANGEFVAQWSEGDSGGTGEFAGKGPGFGFLVQSGETPVRISDIMVSEWNGMPDSARSLQVEDQDVVLMANGTDRYAGKVGGLDEDGTVHFAGRHGTFRFPIGEVAEIRFARNQQAPSPEVPADNVVVRLSPIGAISGRPVSGDATTLNLLSPLIGDVTLSLDAAVMLDFNASNQFINDWDADF